MELPDVIRFLREHKYLLSNKGNYSLSKSFQEDAKKLQVTDVTMNVDAIPIPAHLGNAVIKAIKDGVIFSDIIPLEDWASRFVQFIQLAKVPQYLENSKLEQYAANKYNEDAMKIYRKAVEKEGVDEQLLIRAVQLYYSPSNRNRFKKAIGTYFKDGDWRTDYFAMKNAAQSETTLVNHIKHETDEPRGGAFTF